MLRRFAEIGTLMRFDNRWELIAQRLFFRGTHLQVHRLNGTEAIVDHRATDAGSVRSCMVGDMYWRFVKDMPLAKPATVVDLGANVGGFSLMLHAKNIPVKRLLCVEMNPNTYERLRFNIKLNFPENSHVVHAAAVGRPRTISVGLGWGSTNDSIYRDSTQSAARQMEVSGRTFDDLVASYVGDGPIDVCKIDIEGAEMEVLADPSSENSRLAQCRHIIMEIHPRERFDELIAALRQKGFETIANEGKDRCGIFVFRNVRAVS